MRGVFGLIKTEEPVGLYFLNDLEKVYDGVVRLGELDEMDIYNTYFINQRPCVKGVDLHDIYSTYRRIHSPEVCKILWSMFKGEELLLKNLMFLVSLPYGEEM